MYVVAFKSVRFALELDEQFAPQSSGRDFLKILADFTRRGEWGGVGFWRGAVPAVRRLFLSSCSVSLCFPFVCFPSNVG